MLNLRIFEIELLFEVLYLLVLEVELILKAIHKGVEVCYLALSLLDDGVQLIALVHLAHQKFKEVLSTQSLKVLVMSSGFCSAQMYVSNGQHDICPFYTAIQILPLATYYIPCLGANAKPALFKVPTSLCHLGDTPHRGTDFVLLVIQHCPKEKLAVLCANVESTVVALYGGNDRRKPDAMAASTSLG